MASQFWITGGKMHYKPVRFQDSMVLKIHRSDSPETVQSWYTIHLKPKCYFIKPYEQYFQ